MPIRPILLKGHSRPLTRVKFNRDGDLLFTCGKDHKPNVWYAENGERLGTYNGHNGAVFDCDVNCQRSSTSHTTAASPTTHHSSHHPPLLIPPPFSPLPPLLCVRCQSCPLGC